MITNTLNTFLIVIILLLTGYHIISVRGIKKSAFEEGYIAALKKSSHQLIDEYDRGYSKGKKEKEIQMQEEIELTEKLLEERHRHELQNERLNHKSQVFAKDEQHRKSIEILNAKWSEKMTDSLAVVVGNYDRKVSSLKESLLERKERLQVNKRSKVQEKSSVFCGTSKKGQVLQNTKVILLSMTGVILFSLLLQSFLSKHGRLRWR